MRSVRPRTELPDRVVGSEAPELAIAADSEAASARELRESAAPLTDAYHPIRRIGPPEAPVAGVLAAAGDRRVVLVDAVAAAGRVFSGRDGPPQHLLAPIDVARRVDGHDVELPWCREPVARLLDARAAGGKPLSGGELVTLVVSLLRGTREAWEGMPPEDEPPNGRWWVDDDRRPLFAPAEDGGPVAGEAGALLGQAAAHTRDRVILRLIEEARDALQRPRRLRRTLEPLEAALFEACAPRPIARMSGRVAERASHGMDPFEEDPFDRADAGAAGSTRIAGLLERFVDPGLADTVGDAVDRARTAARRVLGSGRRLPLLAGAAAAGAVLVGGLLWPSDAEPADANARDVSAPPASATPEAEAPGAGSGAAAPTATPAPEPSGAPSHAAPPSGPSASPAAEDAEAAAVRLIGAVAECAAHGDPLCAAARDEPSEPLSDAVLRAAASGVPVLIDDYGDVAVFRLDAPSAEGSAILLQLARWQGRWLLRSAQETTGSG